MPSPPCGQPQKTAYDLRITSDRASVPIARRTVAHYAETLAGFNGEALGDIELAVGEALANAVEHSRSKSISVACRSANDVFEVTIRDGGGGFDPQAVAKTPALSERGYGIGIMRSAMDRVEFLCGGSAIKMRKQCSERSAGAS